MLKQYRETLVGVRDLLPLQREACFPIKGGPSQVPDMNDAAVERDFLLRVV